MIHSVIRNIQPRCSHRFVFICLEEHIQNYKIDEYLKTIVPGCVIVVIDTVTEGAACTVLKAKEYFDNPEESLMIANSDQWVDIDINDYLRTFDDLGTDGMIMTMRADDTKWSFIRFDEAGDPVEVVEKEVVSNEATVGIYNFRRGSDYVWAAERMIEKDLRVNNEFYVAPVYNELLSSNKKISIYNIGKVLDGMYGLGTPEDLEEFLKLPVSKQAIGS
jgi:NDP-sugar pyrophosphorylase family protein